MTNEQNTAPQAQFLEAGEPSPITEDSKNQLAWSYTPAGQLMDELIKELDDINVTNKEDE